MRAPPEPGFDLMRIPPTSQIFRYTLMSGHEMLETFCPSRTTFSRSLEVCVENLIISGTSFTYLAYVDLDAVSLYRPGRSLKHVERQTQVLLTTYLATCPIDAASEVPSCVYLDVAQVSYPRVIPSDQQGTQVLCARPSFLIHICVFQYLMGV